MPVIIIIAALVILIWSLWSDRQDRRQAARAVDDLVVATCLGQVPPPTIRWSNALVRESCLRALKGLCGLDPGRRAAVIVESEELENGITALINAGGSPHLSLTLVISPDDKLVIQGWSTE